MKKRTAVTLWVVVPALVFVTCSYSYVPVVYWVGYWTYYKYNRPLFHNRYVVDEFYPLGGWIQTPTAAISSGYGALIDFERNVLLVVYPRRKDVLHDQIMIDWMRKKALPPKPADRLFVLDAKDQLHTSPLKPGEARQIFEQLQQARDEGFRDVGARMGVTAEPGKRETPRAGQDLKTAE